MLYFHHSPIVETFCESKFILETCLYKATRASTLNSLITRSRLRKTDTIILLQETYKYKCFGELMMLKQRSRTEVPLK